MSRIVTWSIVNNEIDFIKDILDYHLSWVDGMYVLDTGSTDGTLEFLREYNDPRVIIEEYPVKYKTQYDKNWHEMDDPFPEVVVRNYALDRTSHFFQPDWLVQLDGDEVFLDTTREIIEQNEKMVSCIGHSTINPVCKLEEHPLEMRQDVVLYDPHVRIWRDRQEIKYIENPAFNGKQYHCIPTFHGMHLFHHPFVKFVGQPAHFHLHWMYGYKVDSFFLNKGISNKSDILKEQALHSYSEYLPVLFWQRRQEWLDR